jgi:hypothetical protein
MSSNGHTIKGTDCFSDGFNLIDGQDAHRVYVHHGRVLNASDDGIHLGSNAKVEEVFVSGSHGEGIQVETDIVVFDHNGRTTAGARSEVYVADEAIRATRSFFSSSGRMYFSRQTFASPCGILPACIICVALNGDNVSP